MKYSPHPPPEQDTDTQPLKAQRELRKGSVISRRAGKSHRMAALAEWLFAMPTGRKIFAAIFAALAPLALITLIANIQSARAGDRDRLALITSENNDIARRIAATLTTDEQLVRRPLSSIDLSQIDSVEMGIVCEDIRQALLSAKRFAPELHILQPNTNRHLCHSDLSERDTALSAMDLGRPKLVINPDIEAAVDIIKFRDINDISVTALLVYPVAMLTELATPTTTLPAHDVGIRDATSSLLLIEQLSTAFPSSLLQTQAAVGRTGTYVEMATTRKSLSRNDAVSYFVPIGMWLLAAALAWVLLNQLILRPLREMQAAVAGYHPGKRYRRPTRSGGVAIEILELERDMAHLSEMVAEDKRALALGLEQQTLLTREVHHRVKNNLQIIASLLSIHSRSASTPEATEAYRSIQRRVDALSVVHRNHFAELEDNEGIALRPLVSELGTGLRGSDPRDATLNLSIKVAPVYVTQDVAVPVAFLITEITEIALLTDPSLPLSITVRESETETGLAKLIIQSDALKTSDTLTMLLETRFGRVLTGLARQLRQSLDHDVAQGRYAIFFPTTRDPDDTGAGQ